MANRVNQGHFKGDLAEMIVYDQALDNKERSNVEQYLVKKYSLKNK